MAAEATEFLSIPREQLQELTRACFQITTILVHMMLDRARLFTSSDLQNEKMISLGKLSAGLAHELNNPASAIERNATLLEDRLAEAEAATHALGVARLSDAQLAAVEATRTACIAKAPEGVRSPVQQAEREEQIADWLADHGLDESMADALADTQVSFAALDELADVVQGSALEAVLRWAASGCAVRSLASEIQECGDAYLRPGVGHQGLYSYGSGNGGRAGGHWAGTGQHRCGAQVEGVDRSPPRFQLK